RLLLGHGTLTWPAAADPGVQAWFSVGWPRSVRRAIRYAWRLRPVGLLRDEVGQLPRTGEGEECRRRQRRRDQHGDRHGYRRAAPERTEHRRHPSADTEVGGTDQR